MINNFQDIYSILFLVALVTLIYFLLYNKLFLSYFEPLHMFILSQIFSTIFAIKFIKNYIDIVQVLLSQLFLYIGILIQGKLKKNNKIEFKFNKRNLSFFKVLITVSFFIYIILNIYQIYLTGAILFLENPTLSKGSIFSGGLGIIRRFNWGMGIYTSIGLLMLYFYNRKKKWLIAWLVIIFFSILSGSKGAILIFIYQISLLSYFGRWKYKLDIAKTKKASKIFFILGIFLAIFILYSESDNIEEAFIKFINRLLFYGDIILYYYNPLVFKEFNTLNFIDFFTQVFNPILGFLKIQPYEYPIGYQMVNYTLLENQKLSAVVGPNFQYFSLGRVYFGYIGGIFYSFLVGLVIGAVRKFSFADKGKDSIFKSCFKVWMQLNIFVLPMELSYFITKINDLFFFYILIFIFSYIIYFALRKKRGI